MTFFAKIVPYEPLEMSKMELTSSIFFLGHFLLSAIQAKEFSYRFLGGVQ